MSKKKKSVEKMGTPAKPEPSSKSGPEKPEPHVKRPGIYPGDLPPRRRPPSKPSE